MVKFLILLLAVMMVVRPIVPVLEYAINYEYISEVLCINKQKPETSCKGKCHLKKQLNGVFDDSANSGTSGSGKLTLSEEITAIYFFNLPAFDFHLSHSFLKTKYNLKNQDLYALYLTEDFFHPPACFI